jgi:hypothetical protein
MKRPVFLSVFLSCIFCVNSQNEHRNIILFLNGQIPHWSYISDEKIVIEYKNNTKDTIEWEYEIGEIILKENDYEYIKNHKNSIDCIYIKFTCIFYEKKGRFNCRFYYPVTYYDLIESTYFVMNLRIINLKKALYATEMESSSAWSKIHPLIALPKYRVISNPVRKGRIESQDLEMQLYLTDDKYYQDNHKARKK